MNEYSVIKNIIQTRRTTKPPMMNGRLIPKEQVLDLLDLANWAPTHGLTEPWRFKVYAGSKVQEFCRSHADLYQQHTPTEKFGQEKYDKLLKMGDKASHIIIAIMQRGQVPTIPALEEIAATACAIQNILLGATAQGIASYWGSGGMAYRPEMKAFLGLGEEDLVLGILYLGYSDSQLTGRRNTDSLTKVDWME